MIRVALDAMGGDFAPVEIVAGAVEAVRENDNINVILCGSKEAFDLLPEDLKDGSRIIFKETTEVIETGEHPVNAIRTKKDSSLVCAFNLLKNGEADAVVSAGNTGAVLAGGQFLAGRLPGVKRSPLALIVPTLKNQTLMLDVGANVDARPEHLVQFAIMGSVYMERICKVKNPKVAIVNIGSEEEKGNALVKATYPLLKENEHINFVGNIEPRDVCAGDVDVIVCEAFVGNVILKTLEGVSKTIVSMVKDVLMSSIGTKIGALFIKGPLKNKLSVLSSSSHGGAPLLGLSGLVLKTHGNSSRTEIKNSILQCEEFVNAGVTEAMKGLFNGI